MDERWTPLHINWINALWNYTKRIAICSWRGHDVVMTQCFTCWKWDKTWGEQ